MSRLRENPERLFEVFVEVAKPADEKSEPFILQKYPNEYKDEEVLKSVPKFAFPCDTERYTTTVDHFTFTLTDLESKYKFGFCRHATGAQTCFCIISFLPWFEVFYSFLNILAEITNRSEDNDVTVMLREAYVNEVPLPSVPVTVVAGQEMFSFKAPENNKLTSIPASRNLTEYYNAVDTNKMAEIFASMLHERRIVVTSRKLSRLTAVVHASAGLLYPMFWQHLYIPVLPTHLIDYIYAPMPYVIGVHAKLFEKVKMEDLGDAVIVDADKNLVTSEYDDVEDLPDEISSHLRRHLKGEKVKNSMQGTGDVISKTFMLALVKLIGGYRDALKFNEGETITFNPEAFVQSRPLSMQPFLEFMLQLQLFQQFINDRLDMLNCGKGFTDLFEQECLLHVDKLNAQSRYKEWLHNMKKQGRKVQRGGKDVWADFKDKAGPAMTSAVESVKNQGKKAYSGFRTKIVDFKKDEGVSPKQSSKSVRHGPQTKSFTKERPSTIVGQPLTTQRPPRPVMSSPGVESKPPRPQVTVKHPVVDRRTGLRESDRVSMEDTDILMYNRISCNLMSDPDIQHAMFKSASAENLPKQDPSLQNSSSSDSVSSGENTAQHNDDASSRGTSVFYSNLTNEDDVKPTENINRSNFQQSHTEPVAPPRKPRQSPQTQIQDKLISMTSQPPPLPARRRTLEKTEIQPSISAEELLINLDSPDTDGKGSTQGLTFIDDLEGEPIWDQGTGTPRGQSSRKSISRTPAMKVPADQTPKRVSIRRERSPITPEKETNAKTNNMLLFDPLFDQSEATPVKRLGHDFEADASAGSSDSLLKSWDIERLTLRPTASATSYGHVQSESMTVGQQKHSSHSSSSTSQLLSTPPKPQTRTSPAAPPRPAPFRPVSNSPFLAVQNKASGNVDPIVAGGAPNKIVNTADPFADLVTLSRGPKSHSPAPAPKTTWETFD